MVESEKFTILDLFDPDTELVEKSDGSYKTECPHCGLQGGRTKGFIVWPEDNRWYCHSSGKHGSLLEFVALRNKIISCNDCLETGEKRRVLEAEQFKETLDVLKEEYGDEIYNQVLKAANIRKPLQIPGNNRLVSNFANDLAKRLKDEHILFYRSDTRSIVEIGKIKQPNGEYIENGFINLQANRFITLIERYFVPWAEKFGKNGKYVVNQSMPNSAASTVLVSDNFRESMPVICRIFPVQIPTIYNGELTFPKRGYDERFGSWLPHSAPKITNPDMSVEEAKELLHKLYKDFCFKSKQDYTNAIAALITPSLRGIYSDFSVRSPVVFYRGNRQRVGKDYCAGITGIVYEGSAIEEPPIANNERGGNSSDEVRKKIMSTMIQGRPRFHSSNNKGKIDNAVFESVTTLRSFSDRMLGKNEILTLPNEIDYSLSGNTNVTLTPDLDNRCMFVNLFLDIEDANLRKFETPNLHEWVLQNRENILSAIYALIRNWFEKGNPAGSTPFASFPEWANICGGIMEAAGYDSPCKKTGEGLGIAADQETEEMKLLFEVCNETRPDEWLSKKDIKKIIQDSEEDVFGYMDWDKMSDQVKFGKKIDKFIGRILSDVKLHVDNLEQRGSRRKYKFTKETADFDEKTAKSSDNPEKVVRLGKVGKVCTPAENVLYKEIMRSTTQPTKPTNLTKSKKIDKSDRELQFYETPETENIKPTCEKEEVKNFLVQNPETTGEQLYERFGTGSLKFRNELKTEGLI